MLILNRLFLRNKTILTSFKGPLVYNIVKAFSFVVYFENKSLYMPHEALEIISELNTLFH